MITIVKTKRWKSLSKRVDALQQQLDGEFEHRINMELHLKRAQTENNILTAVICVLCILCVVIVEMNKSKGSWPK